MKVFARKHRSSLSLIAPILERSEKYSDANLNLNAGVLKDSFHGWLHAVAHAAPRGLAPKQSSLGDRDIAVLSAEEFIRVNRATIREGEVHRFWPRYVLGKFIEAEVINNSSVTHYVVNDPDITPIRR